MKLAKTDIGVVYIPDDMEFADSKTAELDPLLTKTKLGLFIWNHIWCKGFYLEKIERCGTGYRFYMSVTVNDLAGSTK